MKSIRHSVHTRVHAMMASSSRNSADLPRNSFVSGMADKQVPAANITMAAFVLANMMTKQEVTQTANNNIDSPRRRSTYQDHSEADHSSNTRIYKRRRTMPTANPKVSIT
eukprot:TRINITY_DN2886_c0_g1_i2.p2 TRINITY_DN2886_c0_g1~~TRINITY_DN2886_c0_g1_i2.p2  ORF type:complete len:110 (+),score=15.57 TRINITY_DN2886_c0_g1_i2:115-444(+)